MSGLLGLTSAAASAAAASAQAAMAAGAAGQSGGDKITINATVFGGIHNAGGLQELKETLLTANEAP